VKITDFPERKAKSKPVSMVTVYDYTSGLLCAQTDIDVLLVGDSVAMTMHGHTSTVPADLAMMVAPVKAVAKALADSQSSKLLVADLPYLWALDERANLFAAVRALMQAGAHAIKIEGMGPVVEPIQWLIAAGVPVMGHLGLTPQSVHALGGFKVQGRDPVIQKELQRAIASLEAAGAFAVVLECIPQELGKALTLATKMSTIGIGAGPDCDGQVLVWQDVLGLNTQFKPRFVRSFCEGGALFREALSAYHQAVSERSFPTSEESYQ
jgi:3-methyl-2-oxobutanoate hydroxymethyltransferase